MLRHHRPFIIASVELWQKLEACLTLKAATQDATEIFGLDGDVLAKQAKLKTVAEVYELDPTSFQTVFMEIEAKSDEENAQGHDDVEEVLRLEFDTAAIDVAFEESFVR